MGGIDGVVFSWSSHRRPSRKPSVASGEACFWQVNYPQDAETLADEVHSRGLNPQSARTAFRTPTLQKL